MDKENAKLAQDYSAQNNIPLLQAQQQPVNQYYSPYSPQVQQPQQQVNQQPYIPNPYQGINLQGDQPQANQQLQQQIPQQQQLMQPYQPNPCQQQITGIVLQYPYIPYNPQILQNASGYRTPALVQCPYCNQHSVTTITYKPGNDTYWMAALLCICFGFLCLIPLLSGDCKDVYHQCSYCGKVVGHTPYKACQ
ncbi:unnamed protein product (macronuclear) [Paramecium tetraurelia]|uniref:LITAF domain-containing protein n=1 Tax=Paramecium tetraurelia TaxID=5888 RepID=A0D0N7_PARTE|nr:uncharacterized protein GSPATT00012156001 [Paramecium tetraurelia]CAK76604.1 unnamed protein product [Paramecium tetraurelia]|eukprot:XP_001444001.1 hypothetical protein (macronuclear) [Paramecium tetraurelia strain d4-2]